MVLTRNAHEGSGLYVIEQLMYLLSSDVSERDADRRGNLSAQSFVPADAWD